MTTLTKSNLKTIPQEVLMAADRHREVYLNKFLRLRADIQIGINDIKAGRYVKWDSDKFFNEFLKRNKLQTKVK